MQEASSVGSGLSSGSEGKGGEHSSHSEATNRPHSAVEEDSVCACVHMEWCGVWPEWCGMSMECAVCVVWNEYGVCGVVCGVCGVWCVVCVLVRLLTSICPHQQLHFILQLFLSREGPTEALLNVSQICPTEGTRNALRLLPQGSGSDQLGVPVLPH